MQNPNITLSLTHTLTVDAYTNTTGFLFQFDKFYRMKNE